MDFSGLSDENLNLSVRRELRYSVGNWMWESKIDANSEDNDINVDAFISWIKFNLPIISDRINESNKDTIRTLLSEEIKSIRQERLKDISEQYCDSIAFVFILLFLPPIVYIIFTFSIVGVIFQLDVLIGIFLISFATIAIDFLIYRPTAFMASFFLRRHIYLSGFGRIIFAIFSPIIFFTLLILIPVTKIAEISFSRHRLK